MKQVFHDHGFDATKTALTLRVLFMFNGMANGIVDLLPLHSNSCVHFQGRRGNLKLRSPCSHLHYNPVRTEATFA